VEKLSRHTTRLSWSSNWSTRLDPINPAPPVTSTLASLIMFFFGLVGGCILFLRIGPVLKLLRVLRILILSNCRIVELSNWILSHKISPAVTVGLRIRVLSNCRIVESDSFAYGLFCGYNRSTY